MILALDLGTTTGWAIGKDVATHSGFEKFDRGRFEGGGMRYLKFEQWLEQNWPHVDAVYFEEVRRHLGTDAAHVYGGFLATLTNWCEKHKKPYLGVPVGTIKKFATGKGNAPKDKMIAAANDAGWDGTDDNEADAYWLLRYAMAQGGL